MLAMLAHPHICIKHRSNQSRNILRADTWCEVLHNDPMNVSYCGSGKGCKEGNEATAGTSLSWRLSGSSQLRSRLHLPSPPPLPLTLSTPRTCVLPPNGGCSIARAQQHNLDGNLWSRPDPRQYSRSPRSISLPPITGNRGSYMR